MAKIFISYSHDDKELVAQITSLLEETEIEYFLDEKDVNWGDDITNEINDGLKTSAAILVVISPSSLKSAWVPYETGLATGLGLKVLPYLVHPGTDLPGYIARMKNLRSVDAVREYLNTNLENLSSVAEDRTKPDVRIDVSGIYYQIAGRGVQGISINAKNFSGEVVYISNFQIELIGRNEVLFPSEDHVTGKANGAHELNPGDSHSINLRCEDLLNSVNSIDDFGRPFMKDKIGRLYYGDKENLRSFFGDI